MEKCTKKINDHEKIPEIEIEMHLRSEDQITTRLVIHLYKATVHIKKIKTSFGISNVSVIHLVL